MADVKGEDDGDAHEFEEEVLRHARRLHLLPSYGEGADPELRDEDERVEREADVGSKDANLAGVCHFVEAPATGCPGAAEANVAEADGCPGEDCGEAGYGEQPLQDDALLFEVGEEGEDAQQRGDEDGYEGSAASVHVA